MSRKQRDKMIIEQLQEELEMEIDRGNDLCKIIYKMVHQEPLKMFEIERISRIQRNTERQRT